jgi:hypothetical protein
MPPEVKTTETLAADVVAAAQTKAPAVQVPPVTIPTLMNQKLAGKSEFSNLVVYGLIGLLALMLACIAWLWLRVRKASRAGYGWLNDAVTDDAVVDHVPTQFMHSNFYETEAVSQEALEPSFDTKTETEIEVKAEVASKPSDEEIFVEVVEDEQPRVASQVSSLSTQAQTEKPLAKTTKTTANKRIISPLPPHFDDPRFDERVLRTKKKDRDIAHAQPITSSAELMDWVLADTPPKLRSVTTPAPVLDDKPSATTVAKAASSKDDAKGNLIDFDVFAEPEPLNRPTRFVR